MLAFFHTKERIRFLMIVAVIATPILIVTAVVVSNMEASAAAAGEPNDYGGLHYRIEERQGATALPPALASLLPMPAGALMTDINLDTDGAGKVVRATVKAFNPGDFKTIAAFHRASLNPVTRETPTSLTGIREGYEIKLDQSKPGGGVFEKLTPVDYSVNPIKPPKP
jgi:hypothetical protein